jgi:2-dehydro-3-deoxyphosphooctonate aldolase (KDO 8-P synthase)
MLINQKALKILAKVKKEFNLMVTTDIHTPNEAAIAAEFVDVLQIPAFLCRQTDLLLEAAKTNKVVSIKKGQFMAPQAMKFAVDKVKSVGNNKIMLIERGNCFGYSDLVVDFRGIPQMQAFDVPVVLDCTHSLQQPNQSTGVTGGLPHLIETIAKAGTAVGVDGLFIETHPEPFKALSDGANMLPLDKLEPLIEKIMRIRMAIEL